MKNFLKCVVVVLLLFFTLVFFIHLDSDGLDDLCAVVPIGHHAGDYLNKIDSSFRVYGNVCDDCRVIIKKGGLGLGTCVIEIGKSGKIVSTYMDPSGP